MYERKDKDGTVRTYHGVETGRWSLEGPQGRKSHTVHSKQVIVLVGTMGAGIEFYGPFKDGHAAMEWAGENFQAGVTIHMETINIVRSE